MSHDSLGFEAKMDITICRAQEEDEGSLDPPRLAEKLLGLDSCSVRNH